MSGTRLENYSTPDREEQHMPHIGIPADDATQLNKELRQHAIVAKWNKEETAEAENLLQWLLYNQHAQTPAAYSKITAPIIKIVKVYLKTAKKKAINVDPRVVARVNSARRRLALAS